MSTQQLQQQENDVLFNAMLERTFFKAWKTNAEKLINFMGLELIMNYKCNLGCKYCYVHRFGDKLYPPELYADEEKTLSNLDLVIDWLVSNEYAPKLEFFSGEALVQEIGFKCLSRLLAGLGGKVKTRMVIPSNYTFLLSEKLTARVERLLKHSRDVGVPISLSGSFDGKYSEANRPFKQGGEPRDDDYYDRCFAFAKKWGFGFHPMIYSECVEKWKLNFLWFQEMFRKHDLPWTNLYLLEVRNPEWSKQQTRDFTEFIDFLIKWSWKQCREDKAKFMHFIFKRKGFNIFNGVLTTQGRGIGCSMQSQLFVRLGDLAIVPCHRTSYDPFIFGHLKVENGRIAGVTARNVELAVARHSFSAKMFPYCETCPIRELCNFGCLGAQFETTGDLFTPIPSVCRFHHAKIVGMIKAYKEIGVWSNILSHVNPTKARALREIAEWR